MTHAILIRGDEERHISFPTPETFAGFVAAVRAALPDRRWRIYESWDTPTSAEGVEDV